MGPDWFVLIGVVIIVVRAFLDERYESFVTNRSVSLVF